MTTFYENTRMRATGIVLATNKTNNGHIIYVFCTTGVWKLYTKIPPPTMHFYTFEAFINSHNYGLIFAQETGESTVSRNISTSCYQFMSAARKALIKTMVYPIECSSLFVTFLELLMEMETIQPDILICKLYIELLVFHGIMLSKLSLKDHPYGLNISTNDIIITDKLRHLSINTLRSNENSYEDLTSLNYKLSVLIHEMYK